MGTGSPEAQAPSSTYVGEGGCCRQIRQGAQEGWEATSQLEGC